MALLFQTLGRVTRPRLCLTLQQLEANVVRRSSSSSSASRSEDDIDAILSKPTWSVHSLLPTKSTPAGSTTVMPEKLRHLLRLSALPQPSNATEEKDMLDTLESQIRFVKEVQRVDTDHVAPLRSIRDETTEGQEEITVGLADVRSTLDREERVGRMQRIRRDKVEILEHPEGETWDGDALKAANKKQGRYHVVRSGSG